MRGLYLPCSHNCVILIYMDGETVSWEALEFEHRKKSADWYWILGIIAIAGALIAIVLDNFLFAILIIIGAFTVALHAKKPPERVHFTLSKRGLEIGSTLHPFSSLNSFWIDDSREDAPKLLLTSKRTFSMQLSIPLQSAPQEDIRNMLLVHVREEAQGESIIERAMEWVRF
jgi:hypothetical protein